MRSIGNSLTHPEQVQRIRLTILVLVFFIVSAVFASVLYRVTEGELSEAVLNALIDDALVEVRTLIQ
jgi:hypothetical protein